MAEIDELKTIWLANPQSLMLIYILKVYFKCFMIHIWQF